MKTLKLSIGLVSLMTVAGCAYDGVIYESYTTDDLNYRWSGYQYSGYSTMYYGGYRYSPDYYYYQPTYRYIGVGYVGRNW